MKQVVKSRLLRLSPLESFLEKLIELLPRRVISMALVPGNNITKLSKIGEFKATGYESIFSIKIEGEFTEGWYYLEAAIVRNNGDRTASIIGVTRKQKFEIPVPSNLRGTIREVFYLPSGVTELYWQATKSPGFFSQSDLLIHKIGPLESVLRRAHRVIYDIWRFHRTGWAHKNGLTLGCALKNINDAYSRSAQLRLKKYSGNDYTKFIEFSDKRDRAYSQEIRKTKFYENSPKKFTLVILFRESDIGFLINTIDSIITQCYSNFELLVVDCSYDKTRLGDFLRAKYSDERVLPFVPPKALESKCASVLLNYAISKATGSFFLRIACGDILPSYALTYFAYEFYINSIVAMVYGDNDSIALDGQRCFPDFKPDWNIDLLFSHNYIGFPCVYLISKINAIGGYCPDFCFAEDYDLMLRYQNGMAQNNIAHIQTVLYHRVTQSEVLNVPSGVSFSGYSSDVLHNQGKKALQRNFSKLGVTVEDGLSSCLYHAIYPLPSPRPLVSIIIPTKDRVDLLRVCIDSILAGTDYDNFEIIVVDNNSSDPETFRYFEEIKNENITVAEYKYDFNYSAINNFAAGLSKGSVLALLNNDVEVINKNWLDELVRHAIRPGIGAVGAKLLYPDGSVQHAGVIIGLGGVAGHAHRFLDNVDLGYCSRAVVTQNISAVTGACLVVRKDLYFEVGGLNSEDLSVAFNDVDLCLKLRERGYRNLYTPFARLYHHESISRGHDDTPEKAARFEHEYEYMKKFWGDKLKNDPAYNRNLTLSFENFSLSDRI